MPIASSAASWTPSQNASLRSSMCSDETPKPDPVVVVSDNGLAFQDNDNCNGGQNRDDFKDNPVSSSISNLSCPPTISNRNITSPHAAGTESDSSEELSWLREKCGEIVDDDRVQLTILMLIAINSVMIGIATYPIVKENARISTIFEGIDLFVLIIFTIESIIQFIFNGARRFFNDGWLVFDLVVVGVSWVSVEFEDLQACRVFRALRFVTRVDVLRNVVVALLSIVPAITAIFTLLILIFYIFGVMFTALFKNLYKEGYTSANYFGRLDHTLFTLFQILCLDEWSGIAYEVTEEYFWAWSIFIPFVVISAFVVVNLLIAVICDALQILRTAEQAMLEQKLWDENNQQDPNEEQNSTGEERGDGDEGEIVSHENMRRQIAEMQHMLDQMVLSQETMAMTIQYLSLALLAGKKADEIDTIREYEIEDIPCIKEGELEIEDDASIKEGELEIEDAPSKKKEELKIEDAPSIKKEEMIIEDAPSIKKEELIIEDTSSIKKEELIIEVTSSIKKGASQGASEEENSSVEVSHIGGGVIDDIRGDPAPINT